MGCKPVIRYTARRIFQLIPVLFGVSIIVFAIINLIPGDPAQVILGERADAESIQKLRHELGLDLPLYQQYGNYLLNILQGDLGTSLVTGKAISEELLPHLAATAELTLFAMIFAVIVGVNVGIVSAWKRNTWIDYIPMLLALVGVSMPIFWLGLMEQWLFGLQLEWLPVLGRNDPRVTVETITHFYLIDTLLAGNYEQFWSSVRHLILPAMALGTIPMAYIARMTRSSMLEVLKHDYVRTARAKGLHEFFVVYKHGLKNAFAPVMTIIGLEVGRLLGGAVLTETIFGWPGVGQYIYNAIGYRDYAVIQSGILVLAVIFIVVNLIVDLLYSYLDPRIQYK
ncbi:ABC transporter permease [Brevibacillus borstelensis]|jgi:peptide/nickel transport system permease protein|uniref:ABC transporter permease n=1 Tax=Brevibacillus borstelensis TaxID=45462 RepID=UPI0018852A49|nr:ABC transporter permease [Brevibacillus borstelensis]